MLRVIIVCLFLVFANCTTDANNNKGEDFENNTMQTIQKFEEDARRQWELSVRKKPEVIKKSADISEHSSTDKIEFITWFPWFQENPRNIHTIKALAAIKEENSSTFPLIIGVGSWREITLYGNKKGINSVEKPDASPLSNGSINILRLTRLHIIILLLICISI